MFAAASRKSATPSAAWGRILPRLSRTYFSQAALPLRSGKLSPSRLQDRLRNRRIADLRLLPIKLVHVEQYWQLGIPRFSELYVRGFLKGGSCEAIPLEVNAFTLGGRFSPIRARQFSGAARCVNGLWKESSMLE